MQTYSYQLSRIYDYYCWPIIRLKKKKSEIFLFYLLQIESRMNIQRARSGHK